MSDAHEKDRWRELADLLGLPPDSHEPAPKQAPPPPAPPVPPGDSWKQEALAAPTDLPEAQPIEEESHEPAVLEAVSMSESRHATQATAPAPERSAEDEENSRERSRHGGRRGRRGSRRDRDDADQRSQRERSDEGGSREVEQTAPQERAPRDADASFEDTMDDDLAERDEIASEPDDAFEPEEAPAARTAREEEDDEEIDKLTDWNVPSWTELIGSLYRPER